MNDETNEMAHEMDEMAAGLISKNGELSLEEKIKTLQEELAKYMAISSEQDIEIQELKGDREYLKKNLDEMRKEKDNKVLIIHQLNDKIKQVRVEKEAILDSLTHVIQSLS